MTLPILLVLTIFSPALSVQEPDSVGTSYILDEVRVNAVVKRTLSSDARTGQLIIDGRRMGDEASLLSSPDAVAILRTMPQVATNNDLQAGISVRGGSVGDNRFMADGTPIINPMHMLGLFSTYNPAFYSDYTFSAGRIPATWYSSAAGYFDARSSWTPDSVIGGSVAVGLIESHGALSIPLKKGVSSITIGARKTYLDALFPRLLTLGKSTLDYGFSDLNLSYLWYPGPGDALKASVLVNDDKMKIHNNINGNKDGKMGWGNIAAGINWIHKQWDNSVAYSRYRNRFELQEGNRRLDLPSTLSLFMARSVYTGISGWTLETDINCTESSGQYNKESEHRDYYTERVSWNWNAAASYSRILGSLGMEVGMRLSFYHTGGFTRFYPQPRVNLTWNINTRNLIFVSYSRTMGFERLIQESSTGLPADFWVCAYRDLRPLDSHNFEVGISGWLGSSGINYRIEGYYRRMSNCSEFAGSLIDLTNPTYNPLSDVITGPGFSVGMSLALMRQIGRVRGRISYNYGVSRIKMDRFGTDWIPSSCDRPHDFTATLTWQPIRRLTLSATFTHATGQPYTRAKYGYMISENLICEYFPHNSSRLPSYNRLDIGVVYTIAGRGRLNHIIRGSVYNALASHNILFIYTSYNITDGISVQKSVMKSVIPSISYTVQF